MIEIWQKFNEWYWLNVIVLLFPTSIDKGEYSEDAFRLLKVRRLFCGSAPRDLGEWLTFIYRVCQTLYPICVAAVEELWLWFNPLRNAEQIECNVRTLYLKLYVILIWSTSKTCVKQRQCHSAFRTATHAGHNFWTPCTVSDWKL